MLKNIEKDSLLEIKAPWKVLFSQNKSIYFHHIAGRIVHLKRCTREAYWIFHYLAKGSISAQDISSYLKSKGHNATPLGILDYLNPYFEKGIVGLSLDFFKPEWVQSDELIRYRPQLEWFYNFTSSNKNPFIAHQAIQNSRVGIVGLGGVGSLLAVSLAAIGIGNIFLADADTVEVTNLGRQIFYKEDDIGSNKSKAEIIQQHIKQLNHSINTEIFDGFIDSKEKAESFVSNTDIVINTADEPFMKLHEWMNEACLTRDGALLTLMSCYILPLLLPFKTACIRCFLDYQNTYSCHDLNEVENLLTYNKPIPSMSMVSEMFLPAEILIEETIGYITNSWPPRSMDTALWLTIDGVKTQKIKRNAQCPLCGRGA